MEMLLRGFKGVSGKKGELCKKEQRLIDTERRDEGRESERLSDFFNINFC